MKRELIIQVIREVVRGRPIDEVARYTASLPLNVSLSAVRFCEDNDLGLWFELQIRHRNVSVVGELDNFIQDSTSAVVQRKGVEAPGDKTNVK